MLPDLTAQLTQGVGLSDSQTRLAIDLLIREDICVETKAEFLRALARKGETPEEIAGFARVLRDRAVRPPLDDATRQREILDVCGTGGDHQNTFNISTTVALIAAAAGVTVAKHGNRAITSQSGSADVLEELGIPIDLTPERASAALRDFGFAFFFAPNYHPAFKHIGAARKLCSATGQRTIFNFLGPLLNPVAPSAQLIGVPAPDLCRPLAQVLQSLGVRRGMIVCGRAGTGFLDEVSSLGETSVAEFYQAHALSLSSLIPDSFDLPPHSLVDLVGGTRETNAQIIRDILSGRETGPKLHAALLNAGAALFVVGRCRSILEGLEIATDVIRSGAAAAKLQQLSRSRV
ncbi:MAG: anthranilate phosphoribosyltransferase [Verrucomicrobia bacterium]|nr:anthranilate phosphoribosyltransferase [Verrucomicrobiota bacterium]